MEGARGSDINSFRRYVVETTTITNGGIGKYLYFYLSIPTCGKLCVKLGGKYVRKAKK